MTANEKPMPTTNWSTIKNLGPILPLLNDETINDILINNHKEIYVERKGKLEKTDISFVDEAALREMAQSIVAAVGRELDPNRPLVDARLMDGSRVNVISQPLAVDGTSISIRKFSRRKITLDDMAAQGNMSVAMAEFLKIVSHCRMNIIICGGTGSGKTTLMNALTRHISDSERIVTIEDAAELQLQQPHVVRLETKPLTVGADPAEEVSIRDLVKNALRMRPDRIIVGEVRGSEAFDMMQAMNTGHEGSLTTIHANHPRDGMARLENMISMANLHIPPRSLRAQIVSAVHLMVQISRMRDGMRRITYVSEIIGMEGDVITMNDLFQFVSEGDGDDGKIKGHFQWTGILPRCLKRVSYYGELDKLAKALGIKIPKL